MKLKIRCVIETEVEVTKDDYDGVENCRTMLKIEQDQFEDTLVGLVTNSDAKITATLELEGEKISWVK